MPPAIPACPAAATRSSMPCATRILISSLLGSGWADRPAVLGTGGDGYRLRRRGCAHVLHRPDGNRRPGGPDGRKAQAGLHGGVESTFPYYAFRLLEEHAKPANIQVIDDLLSQLRLVKSPAEIELIRQSTQIIDRTVMELAQNLRLGMGRLELIREAKARMLQNGADGMDHVTVAFGTANPEIALDEPLEPNQIVTLDLGAVYQGYVSDNRRLVYTGTVPEALKELHKKLCWVVAEMGKALRPGKTFSEVHAYAC